MNIKASNLHFSQIFVQIDVFKDIGLQSEFTRKAFHLQVVSQNFTVHQAPNLATFFHAPVNV